MAQTHPLITVIPEYPSSFGSENQLPFSGVRNRTPRHHATQPSDIVHVTPPTKRETYAFRQYKRALIRLISASLVSVLLAVTLIVLTALYPHAPLGHNGRTAMETIHWVGGIPCVRVKIGDPNQIYTLALFFTSEFTNITLFEETAMSHSAYSATYDALHGSDILQLPYPAGYIRVPVTVLPPSYTIPESIILARKGIDGVFPLGPASFAWTIPVWQSVLVTYERLYLYHLGVDATSETPFVFARADGTIACTNVAAESTNVSFTDNDEHVWHMAAHFTDLSLPEVTRAVLLDRHEHASRICRSTYITWIATTSANISATTLIVDTLGHSDDGANDTDIPDALKVRARVPLRETSDYIDMSMRLYQITGDPASGFLISPDESISCTHVHLGYSMLRQNALLLRNSFTSDGASVLHQSVCIHPHRDRTWTHLGFSEILGILLLVPAIFVALQVFITEYHIGVTVDIASRPLSFLIQIAPVIYASGRIVYVESDSINGAGDAHNPWLGASPAYRGGSTIVTLAALSLCLLINALVYGGSSSPNKGLLNINRRAKWKNQLSSSAASLLAVWAIITPIYVSLVLIYESRVVLFSYEDPTNLAVSLLYIIITGVLSWCSVLNFGMDDLFVPKGLKRKMFHLAWEWPLWAVLRPVTHLTVWIGYILPYQAHRFRLGTSPTVHTVFSIIMALVVEFLCISLAAKLVAQQHQKHTKSDAEIDPPHSIADQGPAPQGQTWPGMPEQ